MSNNFAASLGVLESRLSAARAGYLDNLSGGAVSLASVMSATRGGYLDNLSGGAVGLEATLGTIDNLVDDLETRLSAARAGYLDNLSGGAVGLEATLSAIPTSPIKSIQYVAGQIAISAADDDVTISAVVVANTVPLGNQSRANNANPQNVDDVPTITITSTTNVRWNTWQAAVGVATETYSYIVEFS